jgi:uncharacterized protein (DUF2461 family)
MPCGRVKGQNRPGYYIHLDPKEAFIAGGLYVPEATELKNLKKLHFLGFKRNSE